MKTARSIALIVSLAVVGVALVDLRWQQTRIASGLLRAETRWVAMRRVWWSVQASTARFRSPARMRGRAGVLQNSPRLLVDRHGVTDDVGIPIVARFHDGSRPE